MTGAVILASLIAAGACLVAFVTTGAEPEIRVTLTEIEEKEPQPTMPEMGAL